LSTGRDRSAQQSQELIPATYCRDRTYLRKCEPDNRNIDRSNNNEDQIVLPPNIGKCSRGRIQVGNCRQEQRPYRPGHAPGTDVRREDLRRIYKAIGINATSIAASSQ
jgi:hypothetical protein